MHDIAEQSKTNMVFLIFMSMCVYVVPPKKNLGAISAAQLALKLNGSTIGKILRLEREKGSMGRVVRPV
jgi:hypothetical protein